MEVERLRMLVLEFFKTLKNLNPSYMKNIFRKTSFTIHKPSNLSVNLAKTTKYSTKSVKKLRTTNLGFFIPRNKE